MIRTEKILDAIGMINEAAVRDAKAYKRPKSRSWVKWCAMAACLCLVLAGVFGGSHSYFMLYAANHNIQVVSDYTDDRISAADVTPEQAKKWAAANEMRNLIVTLNLDWYGSCYYDFETDRIMIGLTENTTENQEVILSIADNIPVQFYKCEYSYAYLNELYEKLDSKRAVLSAVGVERFNISVNENRIVVYVTSTDNYAAIYVANELDSIGGAIQFRTSTPATDMRS